MPSEKAYSYRIERASEGRWVLTLFIRGVRMTTVPGEFDVLVRHAHHWARGMRGESYTREGV